MSVEFRLTTMIPVGPERAFDLSRDIDEHLSSMARSRERAVAGRTSGLIELGESVTWRAIHFGVPFSMTSVITEMESPHRFVDEQIRGPFVRFRHEHRFTAVPGGTEMIDEVSFTAPFGALGRIAERIALERKLRGLIIERNEHLVMRARAAS